MQENTKNEEIGLIYEEIYQILSQKINDILLKPLETSIVLIEMSVSKITILIKITKNLLKKFKRVFQNSLIFKFEQEKRLLTDLFEVIYDKIKIVLKEFFENSSIKSFPDF